MVEVEVAILRVSLQNWWPVSTTWPLVYVTGYPRIPASKSVVVLPEKFLFLVTKPPLGFYSLSRTRLLVTPFASSCQLNFPIPAQNKGVLFTPFKAFLILSNCFCPCTLWTRFLHAFWNTSILRVNFKRCSWTPTTVLEASEGYEGLGEYGCALLCYIHPHDAPLPSVI